jgi:hypothetical protein
MLYPEIKKAGKPAIDCSGDAVLFMVPAFRN